MTVTANALATVTIMNSHRERLFGMIDEGIVGPKTMIEWLVGWLSEDDVGAFLDAYELSERFEETEAEARERLLYNNRRNNRY